MTRKESMEKFRKKRKEKQLCLVCGRSVEEENLVTCRVCRRYIAKMTRMRRENRHENGLCVYCAKPMPERDEHKNCPACRAFFADGMRKRAEQKKETTA